MTLELFLAIAGFVAALAGGAWALVKLAAAQFAKKLDERFKAQERLRQEARVEYGRKFERLEAFQTEVYRDFVRREDYVRDIGSIKIMIENLALNIDRRFVEIWQEIRKKA